MRPADLKPAATLAADKPHCTRIRYMGGCKCFHCRRANSDYERERQAARLRGEGNGLVDVTEAVAHIRCLSRQGVGYKSVAEAARLSHTTVAKLLNGTRTRMRAQAVKRILGVTVAARADHVTISAKRLWRRINLLLEEGYTKTYLAQRLGKTSIQFRKDRVTVRNDADVARLYRELTGLRAPSGTLRIAPGRGSPLPGHRSCQGSRLRPGNGGRDGLHSGCAFSTRCACSPLTPSAEGEITSRSLCQSSGSSSPRFAGV